MTAISGNKARILCSEDPECAMVDEELKWKSGKQVPTGTYRFCREVARQDRFIWLFTMYNLYVKGKNYYITQLVILHSNKYIKNKRQFI